jgi:hypothetical protein
MWRCRDDMNSNSNLKQRIRNGLLVLKTGQPYRISDLVLRVKNDGCLHVYARSRNSILKSISEKSAVEELKLIEQKFNYLCNLSSKLHDFSIGREKILTITLRDGMSEIGVCSLIKEEIEWHVDI